MRVETVNDTNAFDKKSEVLKLLESVQRKFRYAPTQKYIVEVADFLEKRLRIAEIHEYLKELHLKHHSFPDMRTMEFEVRELVKKQRANLKPMLSSALPPSREPAWVSTQAAGTPANVEALFNRIKKGKTDGTGFRLARNSKHTKHLTDEQLWECYEAWCQGKLHPLLKKEDQEKDIFE